MRTMLFAALVAAGVGLAGTAVPTVAAPISGVAIGELAGNSAINVQHHRRRSARAHRRRGSYGHSRWRSQRAHHNRWRSRRSRGCHIVPFSFWAPC